MSLKTINDKHHCELFVFYILLFNYGTLICSIEERWIENSSVLRELFLNEINNIAIQTAQLCNFPIERKLAICDYIITKTRQNRFIDTPHKYLNKTASSLINMDCIKRPVTFLKETNAEFNIVIPSQYMLKCYYRNNPLRTSWLEDEAFDLIYVCGGSNDSSFIILEHELQTVYDYYIPINMVENLEVINLPEVHIKKSDQINEVKLLKSVTRNLDFTANETMFIRALIKNSKLETYDPICKLKTSKKISLCQKVMTFGYNFLTDWKLNEDAFNDDSSQCVEKQLHFKYESTFDIDEIVYQKMYPCYGQHRYRNLGQWYLSSGFHDNSVLLYREYESQTALNEVDELYENVELENLENLVTVRISIDKLLQEE